MVAKRSELVVFAFVYVTVRRVFELVALLCRSREAKELEILVLRHQLAVLHRQHARPQLRHADRALLAALSRVLPRTRWSVFFVEPDTLLRSLLAAGATGAGPGGRASPGRSVTSCGV